MKKRIFASLALASSLLFTGCSTKALMPYDEDFTCPRSADGGMCGDMSTIYLKGLKKDNTTGKPVTAAALLKTATNIDEEQTALLVTLWRMNKATNERIDKLDQKHSQSEMRYQMTAGITASLASDIRKTKEDTARLVGTVDELQAELRQKNAASNEVTTKQSTENKAGSKRKQKQRFGESESTCKLANTTKEECVANSECYSLRNIYLSKMPKKCSSNIKVIPKCTTLTVGDSKDGWLKVGEGWVAAKYLRAMKKEVGADKNTSKAIIPFTSDKNKTVIKKGDANATSK